MISLDEALDLIKEQITPTTRIETVPLNRALGGTLAADLFSDRAMPPFDRVTMDGYAVRSDDATVSRKVIDSVAAGQVTKKKIAVGECMKVMTGAPLPAGADAVVPVEATAGYVAVGESIAINGTVRPNQYYAPCGEDIKEGDTLMTRGQPIAAAEIALLAAAGADPVSVVSPPRVAILSTGDELVPPSAIPGPGQIRDSNAYGLAAQLQSMALHPTILKTASDEKEELRDRLREGGRFNFLLVSGGVSAGDRDYLPQLLLASGYEKVFHKVAIKPGHPVWFGCKPTGECVFGLPGNPVSAYVLFELMVKPALRYLGGEGWHRGEKITAQLASDYHRKKVSREEFVPVTLRFSRGRGYEAIVVPYHGSGHLHALVGSNGLMQIPAGVSSLAAGSYVTAHLL